MKVYAYVKYIFADINTQTAYKNFPADLIWLVEVFQSGSILCSIAREGGWSERYFLNFIYFFFQKYIFHIVRLIDSLRIFKN